MIASRPGTEQITDPTGSGPFRFLKDEWVSGARCAYARFDGYVPRQEPPAFFAGGKVAHFERVEWTVQPDPATAAAALQKNEADWLEQPLIDLYPDAEQVAGRLHQGDRSGRLADVHGAQPSEPAVRQPEGASGDHRSRWTSRPSSIPSVGDQQELAIVPTGLFAPTMPMANNAGLEQLTTPRDLAKAKQMIAGSGYKGEPVVIMSPSDQPVLSNCAKLGSTLPTCPRRKRSRNRSSSSFSRRFRSCRYAACSSRRRFAATSRTWSRPPSRCSGARGEDRSDRTNFWAGSPSTYSAGITPVLNINTCTPYLLQEREKLALF